jgi:hypothetical protein
MAFFIAQLARTSKDTFSVAKAHCHRTLDSLELLLRWVMKNALLAPPSVGGRTSKRFSSP